jgi:hypothetical protein
MLSQKVRAHEDVIRAKGVIKKRNRRTEEGGERKGLGEPYRKYDSLKKTVTCCMYLLVFCSIVVVIW